MVGFKVFLSVEFAGSGLLGRFYWVGLAWSKACIFGSDEFSKVRFSVSGLIGLVCSVEFAGSVMTILFCCVVFSRSGCLSLV